MLTALDHLSGQGLLDIDSSEIKSAYRFVILENVKEAFRNHDNYEFMHGAAGMILPYAADREFAEILTENLEKNAEVHGDGLKWESLLNLEKTPGYNISLSHGISGLLLCLCEIHRSCPDSSLTRRMEKLIAGGSNYLLSQQFDPRTYGCYFPSISLESDPSFGLSRLAWCYGDLGVAMALLETGSLLEEAKYRQVAMKALQMTVGRREQRETYVYDTGICHGSAGVAVIYDHLYRRTGLPEFREAYEYWIDMTIKMGYHTGNAGYRAQRFNKEHGAGEWESEQSLLEGIAGIGLTLLSYLYPEAGVWYDLLLMTTKNRAEILS